MSSTSSGSSTTTTTTNPSTATVIAPSPDPKRSGIFHLLVFFAGTILGWLTEDLIKKPVVDFIESSLQAYVPWDSAFVQWWAPNTIRFEASAISGCSGGGLSSRLMDQAKSQGLNFPEQDEVAEARLCQSWTYHGSARSVLEHMATKFDNCFSLDQTHSFFIKLNQEFVCKTDYTLTKTNEWAKTPGAATLLCLDHGVDTPMSNIEPKAHECPESELIRLQFKP